MIEFGYILIIIFEVIITFFIVWGLIYLENKIKDCLEAVNIEAHGALVAVKDINSALKNFNCCYSKAKKFEIKKIKQLFALALDIIELVVLIRGAGFKKIFIKKLLRKFV